jgi:hypothetical protein
VLLPAWRGIDSTQRWYFWSQFRPLLAGQATPALRAAAVSVSSHLLRAVQTCVSEVLVLTAGPGTPALSALPRGPSSWNGPPIPMSSNSSASGAGSSVATVQAAKLGARANNRESSTRVGRRVIVDSVDLLWWGDRPFISLSPRGRVQSR